MSKKNSFSEFNNLNINENEIENTENEDIHPEMNIVLNIDLNNKNNQLPEIQTLNQNLNEELLNNSQENENQLNESIESNEYNYLDDIESSTPKLIIPESKKYNGDGEENYIELQVGRCKGFRFKDGEWKERGFGEFKVLKSNVKENYNIFIMRQDKTFKFMLYFIINENFSYSNHQGSEKTIVLNKIHDFSDSLSNPVESLLSIKFDSIESKNSFDDTVEKIIFELKENKKLESIVKDKQKENE